MKLILTSRGFGDAKITEAVLASLGKPASEIRLLYIATAVYGYSRKNKLLEALYALGFLPENICWFDHRYPERVTGNFDLIYTCGGNTFQLAALLRKSGFLPTLKEMILAGVPYLGASAGTHLVTESFAHLVYFDENKAGVTDFSGLGLFPGVCVCHYGPDRFAVTEELRDQGKYAVYPLDHAQILWAEGCASDHLEIRIETTKGGCV